MRVERHIFGSRTGYTTLAKSPGMTADDCRQLESAAFGFGQTYDERYPSSLAQHPAFFTRDFNGQRRSLTRIQIDALDDHGRPGLMFLTVILSQRDWDEQLRGDISWLLSWRDLWTWNGNTNLPAVEIPPCSKRRSIPKSQSWLELLSAVEHNFTAKRQTVVSSADYGPDQIAALEMIFPPRASRRLTTASRALKVLPADVVALALEASVQSVSFRPTGAATQLSPYAQVIRNAEASQGSFPYEEIMAYENFGEDFSPLPLAPTMQQRVSAPPPRRADSILPLLMLAALTFVASFATYVIARNQSHEEIQQLRAEDEKKIGDLENRIEAELKNQQGDVEKKVYDINHRLNGTDDQGLSAIKTADDMMSMAKAIDLRTARLEDLKLGEFKQSTSDALTTLKRDTQSKLDGLTNTMTGNFSDVNKKIMSDEDKLEALKNATGKPHALDASKAAGD